MNPVPDDNLERGLQQDDVRFRGDSSHGGVAVEFKSPATHQNHLTFCFVPYDERNPYQGELAKHLAVTGLRRGDRSMLKGMIFDIFRGSPVAEIIHLHWLPRFQLGWAASIRRFLFLFRLSALKFLGKRIVWTVHNLYAHESAFRHLEKRFIKQVVSKTSGIIVHSRKAKDLVSSEFNVNPIDKIKTIPHGNYIGVYPNTIPRHQAREKLNLPQDTTVLLFFGNIRSYKGVPELINAYQRAQQQDSILLIVGKPYNAETVTRLQSAIQKTSNIQIRPGFVPDHEVQTYMNAADAVVFPYQDVLTSGAVILAMSFGKACIAPSIGCIPDVLDDSGAFLYNPAEPNGLQNALTKAIRSNSRLGEMGAFNFSRASEWGWDRIAKETAQVYSEVLAAK